MKYMYIICYCIFLVSCSSYKNGFANEYEKQEVTVSEENYNSPIGRTKYHTTSDNYNTLTLGFKERFNDTIGIIINDKFYEEFAKHDEVDCYDCSPNVVFKSYIVNYENDKVKIYLKSEKKYIDITLNNKYNTYIISRYNSSWYVNLWPRKRNG